MAENPVCTWQGFLLSLPERKKFMREVVEDVACNKKAEETTADRVFFRYFS